MIPDWLYAASILVVDQTGTISHYATTVKANSEAEAKGKLQMAAERLFPTAKNLYTRVANVNKFNPIDDPLKAGIVK